MIGSAYRWLVPVLVIFALAQSVFSADGPPHSPLSPEDSLRHFVLPKGLKIEIVACEPQIVDPVSMRFDEQGRLWVVELRDYPHGPAPGEDPQSQIVRLEDRDGDGRYETSQVFADKLLFGTGIQPWQDGVIATVGGQIVYLKDTNGDGRADVRQPWFTGFAQQNPQLRVNHPRFALDNHIYAAGGLKGGDIQSNRQPQSPTISIRNRDWRFDPRKETGEAVSGNGQFGMTFDDFGNRFLCHNRHPLMHVVLEDRYLVHNPSLAVPAVIHDVAAEGEQSHVFPISQAWTTSHLHAGQFTAACGVDIYRGDALPAEYRGNSFTCEPTGNLVHREILSPAGVTFNGRPAYEGREFLATRDTWFRPVGIESGPDGALYVVDMHRAVIEHPDFMPTELKTRPDLRYGTDRGRIYRIVPAGYRRPSETPNLAKVSAAELVKLFAHSAGWWRETAARLLYERQDPSAVPALERLAKETSASPAARVQALWALQGLSSLDERLLASALADAQPRVREQAILLAEPGVARNQSLRRSIAGLARDHDPRVRFQAALTLGGAPGADLNEPLAAIALAGSDDSWTRRAVETAVPKEAAGVLAIVVKELAGRGKDLTDGQAALVEELAGLVGIERDPAKIAIVLRSGARESSDVPESLELSLLDGLAQGLRSRGTLLSAFATQHAAAHPEMAKETERAFARAAKIASDSEAAMPVRRDACRLLAYAPYAVAKPVLERLLDEPGQELRLAAVAALASHVQPEVGSILVERLPAQTPAVRSAMLDALFTQTGRVHLLLDAIEAGKIKPSELNALRTNRLLASRSPEIKAQATKLLASAIPADRAKALATYQAALKLKPDAYLGKEVFRKNCSTCHKIADVGVDVGPSIGDARMKTPEQLLVDILQPSKAIDNNFVSYSVITTEGNSYTGVISAETPTSVTLRLPEGKTLVLLRSNIEELRSNGISLMPEGLERNIPLADMANLIAFIKNWRYLGGQVPVSP